MISQRGVSHPDFREALRTVAGEGGAINSRRLGKWLGTNQGRIVAECRIILQDKLNAGTTFCCSRAPYRRRGTPPGRALAE